MCVCECVRVHLQLLHYAYWDSKKQRAVWVNCMQSVAIVSWCCCRCGCCCRDKGCARLRPGHDSVCVTMGNTATRQWTNKGSHKMATATATAGAAVVGNKRHVRVKRTPTQQQWQQDDGDNNMQHTHTQAALQDAACLLPVLAMAIVVINGRHNKWVKCPDWVSVSAVCVCVCVWSVASAKVVDRAENAVRGAGERARAVYVLILSCVACKTNYR